ncbi:MAG TPA: MerR family transcriptional regulator [Thermoanaerobaculia bacterium]|nr:MerR family transcriptional regulator [Thermoanaerobaculia bacterium]
MAKAEQEFYKPAEACRIAEVAPYVLRYWETEFPALAEGKEKGAAKLYSSRDVKIIARIRELLYDEGFTVAGAKKRLEAEIAEGRFEDGLKAAPAPAEQKQTPRPSASSRPPAAPREPELAEPAFLSESTSTSAHRASPSEFPERKKVVKELKEIVKLLDRGKTR